MCFVGETSHTLNFALPPQNGSLAIGAVLVGVSVHFTTVSVQVPVFLDYADASRHPWCPQLAFAMCVRAIHLFTYRIHKLPALSSFPMKTLALVVTLLSTPKTGYLHPRCWSIGHVSSNVIRVSHNVNVFSSRKLH